MVCDRKNIYPPICHSKGGVPGCRYQIQPKWGLWVSYCNCWLLFSILLNKQNPRCLPLFSNCHRLPMSKCESRVCYWCSYHILTCSEINCWTDAQQQGTFYSDLIKIIVTEPSVYVEKVYFCENQTTINGELKHVRFWDADGNRKRIFRVRGP